MKNRESSTAESRFNKPYRLHALHGFLGRPEDWSFFSTSLPRTRTLFPHNLFRDFPIAPFSLWANTFNQYIGRSDQGRNILLGYSLGGRLGLHAVLQNPSLWKAAILVSTHTGLTSDEQKQARWEADQRWAGRFEEGAWDPLIEEWNAQEVFKGDSGNLKRKEAEFDRTSLATALRTWSLGKQGNLTAQLTQLDLPILWMVGTEDHKFAEAAQGLTFKHPLSQVCLVPEASHRLPWQQPEQFLLKITQFLHSLE